MSTLGHALRVARNAVLTVGAVLGVVVALGMLVGTLAGVRPVVITSGSMEPSIASGSLAFSRTTPAAETEVGDVVTVRSPSGSRVTHRVVEVAALDDGRAVLRLQGDANPDPDPAPYQADEVGKVVAEVPLVGYVLLAIRSPAGLLAAGALATLLLAFALRGGDRSGGNRPGGSHRGGRRAAGAALPAATAVAVAVAGPAGATAWTDDVQVTGTKVTALVVPTTTLSCGALGLLSVTFNWTAVAGATSYTLFWNGGASSRTVNAPTTSTTLTSAVSSSTAWVVVNRGFGSVTWTSAASNTRSFTVAVVSVCS